MASGSAMATTLDGLDTPLDFDDAPSRCRDNIWFALAGLKTGGARARRWAERLGFDAPHSVRSADGRVAGHQRRRASIGGGFKDRVELANAAYGQGETLVTPLQMALVAATIANDGVTMKPRLVTSTVIGEVGGIMMSERRSCGWSSRPDQAARDPRAMIQAVEGQYGREFTTGAAVPGITTAGKSGTAQLGGSGEPNSWFIGFAPAENPQIAIAVVVEHGGRAGSGRRPWQAS